MTVSFQLYSARNFQPWADVLKLVAGLGYKNVEGFGGVYEDPKAFRALMDQNGLAMPSGHFSMDMLENDFSTAVAIASELGVETIICPFLMPDARPTDRAGWVAFAHRLAAVGEKCKDAGFRFAWHNHDFEFKALADGQVPEEIILENAPNIGWEMDVAWVVRGGADPFAWIERFGPRIWVVHVKDIAPEGDCQDEDGWADVGEGVMKWDELLAGLKSHGQTQLFVMEHDKPSDVQRFARRSLLNFQQL